MVQDVITLPLTQGKVAWISPEDIDLSAFKWFADKQRKQYYCLRNSPTINGKRHFIRIHRVILERMLGRPLLQNEEVDHIDLNPLNNQRSNLRLASYLENARNRKPQTRSSSGYKGVTWFKHPGKWGARIMVNYKQIFLGYFHTAESAHEAYCEASKKYHGEFGRTK